MSLSILGGDCIEVMRGMEEGSVDAIVTDPPYGLEFMGKEWDAPWKDERTDKRGIVDPKEWGGNQDSPNGGNAFSRSRVRTNAAHYGGDAAAVGRQLQEWCESWAREALRVLKPGGHLLAFGGTRTYHRLVCAIEDAGFEIRDSIHWFYGSGFPKSLNVGKAIDKAAGAKREVIGINPRAAQQTGQVNTVALAGDRNPTPPELTAPATPEADQWEGWGTALKPAHEPIVLARKPLIGTVVKNVLAHGTGALNIDASRIGSDVVGWGGKGRSAEAVSTSTSLGGTEPGGYGFADGAARPVRGRFPANVIFDTDAAAELDAQTGGASRFFYVAKPSKAERNRELPAGEKNTHPTVKPVQLMRYLVRLVTPPGGTVLDPFLGSGTTAIAAIDEGFSVIGIERDPDYLKLARTRAGRVMIESLNNRTQTLTG